MTQPESLSLESALKHIAALAAQLAASQERECRMRGLLTAVLPHLAIAHTEDCDKYHVFDGSPEDCECGLIGMNACTCGLDAITEGIDAALAASGPCPHKAEAEARLKQFVTQVSMDHAAICEWEAEVERLRMQVRDYEQELERHATDRVNQRAEVERLRKRLDWIYKQCNDPARAVEQIGADLCRVIAGGEVEGITYANEDEAVDAARLRVVAEPGDKAK